MSSEKVTKLLNKLLENKGCSVKVFRYQPAHQAYQQPLT
jgi:hypothetical protein